MADLFWLSDEQFGRLAPLLPSDTRGVPRVDDRREISGIIHVLQSGCRWPDAPAHYGPYKKLYNRFVRWARKGVWDGVFEQLAVSGGPPAAVMLDSTHVKAHRSATGGTYGPLRCKQFDSVGPSSLQKRIRHSGIAVGQDGDPRVLSLPQFGSLNQLEAES